MSNARAGLSWSLIVKALRNGNGRTVTYEYAAHRLRTELQVSIKSFFGPRERREITGRCQAAAIAIGTHAHRQHRRRSFQRYLVHVAATQFLTQLECVPTHSVTSPFFIFLVSVFSRMIIHCAEESIVSDRRRWCPMFLFHRG